MICVGHDMHGVGRKPDHLGARRLAAPCAMSASCRPAPSQSPADCIAAIGAKSTEWTISGAECRPPEPARRLLVEHAVVVGGRFPAHAADQADGLHRLGMREALPGMSAKASTTLS